MTSITVCTALLVDHDAPVTVTELARFCDQQTEWVVMLVEQGILSGVQGQQPEHWRFASQAVHRARSVARLQRDFEVNLDAAALMADMMDEIHQLKIALSNHR